MSRNGSYVGGSSLISTGNGTLPKPARRLPLSKKQRIRAAQQEELRRERARKRKCIVNRIEALPVLSELEDLKLELNQRHADLARARQIEDQDLASEMHAEIEELRRMMVPLKRTVSKAWGGKKIHTLHDNARRLVAGETLSRSEEGSLHAFLTAELELLSPAADQFKAARKAVQNGQTISMKNCPGPLDPFALSDLLDRSNYLVDRMDFLSRTCDKISSNSEPELIHTP